MKKEFLNRKPNTSYTATKEGIVAFKKTHCCNRKSVKLKKKLNLNFEIQSTFKTKNMRIFTYFFYTGGWKKLEPVWNFIIKTRSLNSMLPLLESILSKVRVRKDNAEIKNALELSMITENQPKSDKMRGDET